MSWLLLVMRATIIKLAEVMSSQAKHAEGKSNQAKLAEVKSSQVTLAEVSRAADEHPLALYPRRRVCMGMGMSLRTRACGPTLSVVSP